MNKPINQKPSNIEKAVMKQIKSGGVHMRPKVYYLLVSTIGVATSILLGLGTVYFFSILSLWFRILINNGPAYGAKRNLGALIESFPLWQLLLGLLLLISFVYLIKKLGYAYKLRLIYIIPLIVIFFLTIGFVLSYSDLPGFMNNNHKTGLGCDIDISECVTDGQMYGHNRIMK